MAPLCQEVATADSDAVCDLARTAGMRRIAVFFADPSSGDDIVKLTRDLFEHYSRVV